MMGLEENCEAARAAETLVRFEELADLITRKPKAEETGDGTIIADVVLPELFANIEDMRSRLAEARPSSFRGAVCQLLAALRDRRVGDVTDIERARKLEASAVAYFGRACLLDQSFSGRLSYISAHHFVEDNGCGPCSQLAEVA
jgi:hypothetical protein